MSGRGCADQRLGPTARFCRWRFRPPWPSRTSFGHVYFGVQFGLAGLAKGGDDRRNIGESGQASRVSPSPSRPCVPGQACRAITQGMIISTRRLDIDFPITCPSSHPGKCASTHYEIRTRPTQLRPPRRRCTPPPSGFLSPHGTVANNKTSSFQTGSPSRITLLVEFGADRSEFEDKVLMFSSVFQCAGVRQQLDSGSVAKSTLGSGFCATVCVQRRAARS